MVLWEAMSPHRSMIRSGSIRGSGYILCRVLHVFSITVWLSRFSSYLQKHIGRWRSCSKSAPRREYECSRCFGIDVEYIPTFHLWLIGWIIYLGAFWYVKIITKSGFMKFVTLNLHIYLMMVMMMIKKTAVLQFFNIMLAVCKTFLSKALLMVSWSLSTEWSMHVEALCDSFIYSLIEERRLTLAFCCMRLKKHKEK